MLPRRYFSLLEVLIALTLVALLMGIAMSKVGDTSDSEARLKFENEVRAIFQNASTRAMAFDQTVKVTFTADFEGALSAKLSAVAGNPESSFNSFAEETEESIADKQLQERVKRLYSGSDSYQLPKQVTLENEDMMDENQKIIYTFFPDGEATGPFVRLLFGEQVWSLTVDRLTGAHHLKLEEEYL